MNRLQKLRENITDAQFDGVIITNPENRRYLSGFSGTAGVLLISANEALIITDFRYWEQVGQEVSQFKLVKQGPKFWPAIQELIKELKWEKVAFESGHLTFQEYQTLTEGLSSQIHFIPTLDLVEKLRSVKDETEIGLISKAAQITDLALAKTLTTIKPGVQERELALEFDYQLRLNGADGNAFRTILISGKKTALPHGVPSEKAVMPGDLIMIDGGALYQGYHADLTRTVVIGKASTEQKKLYEIVLEAQEKALQFLKAGLLGYEVDKAARDYLAFHQCQDYFGHGLGHSVGLNIHENPRLSITEPNPIPKGAVITVEPGVYIPDWGGIRIEDLVVVNDDGVTNLSGSPKAELMEL